MSVMDLETVSKAARLANIDLDDAQKEAARSKLEGIIQFVEQLSEVDTSNVEPLASVNDMDLHWREDVVNDGGISEKVLKNAPESQEGFFVVSKIVE